uniref:PH domain-containing protein n=1 Tax=Octactis speculum TaxID=3111310 RepID=A0A7S2E643_9STRA|mmetsp:Transcript_58364/g.79564  ORF Transcript_58364/g.79564 Transcript_58364/m.79564 type:complete len:347 (+) Transcript_58364:42-1082(+)
MGQCCLAVAGMQESPASNPMHDRSDAPVLSGKLTASEIAEATSKCPPDEQKRVNQILKNTKASDLKKNNVMAAVLLKRSEWKHEWRSRYIILQEDFIFSCKRPADKPTGILRLDSGAKVYLTKEDIEFSILGTNSEWLEEKPFSFAVVDRYGLTWPIACESQKNFDSWTTAIKKCIEDAKLLEVYKSSLLNMVQTGATFVKFNYDRLGSFSKKDQKRFVSVSPDCKQVLWLKPGTREYNDIRVKDIQSVEAGAVTSSFKNNSMKGIDPDKCFSVVSSKRTLDLVASTTVERDEWVLGIKGVARFGSILTEEKLEELQDTKNYETATAKAKRTIEERKKRRKAGNKS